MTEPVNLANLSAKALTDFLQELGEPKYRAPQVLQWLHQRYLLDFEGMTNLSKPLRALLQQKAVIRWPAIASTEYSADGTIKWLVRLDCGNHVESVYIPEANRATLCISSQIGCGLTCEFCSTAKQGFNRNLTTAEIVGQLWLANRLMVDQPQLPRISNVVLMGMGEPLLNCDNVFSALSLMLDDHAYGLSKRRVTLSTSGLVPQMLALKVNSPVALAVSLHAPDDLLRNRLVPINRKYPLAQLIPVCRDYFAKASRRRVTFEYVMLKGVNDRPEQARQLAALLGDVPCKINLIPFNPFPGSGLTCSEPETILAFQHVLLRKGFNTITRKTRGQDIDAACGQLAGQLNDITSRAKRWQTLVFQRQATVNKVDSLEDRWC